MNPNEQPAPQPQEPVAAPDPAPQAPAEPAPQSNPEPQAPTQEPAPQQPAPQAPTEQPNQQPAAQQPQPEQVQYQSLEDYMKEVYGDYEAPSQAPALPTMDDIDPADPEAVNKFFENYASGIRDAAIKEAVAQFRAESRATQIERAAWGEAITQYPDLQTNAQLRDSVQAIREFNFKRGIAVTPKQAADIIMGKNPNDYRRGIADSQVTTTIAEVQPLGGGSAPAPDNSAAENLVNNLGTSSEEAALRDFLAQSIEAGRL